MLQLAKTPLQLRQNEVAGLGKHRVDTGGPGIPSLKGERKPWEGLSSMISMTSSGFWKNK